MKPIKLSSITNNHCDVRDYMHADVSENDRYDLLYELDIDDDTIETVLEYAEIYVNGNDMNQKITPYDIETGDDENE